MPDDIRFDRPDLDRPDLNRHHLDPGAALRALPLLAPPRSAWTQLQAQLPQPAPRRSAGPLWLAAAAVLALAIGATRWWTPAPPNVAAPEIAATIPSVTPSDEQVALQALMTESAQLETLLAWSREGAVESGAAASLGVAMQHRIEQIDALLARPDTDPDALLPLWQERVLRLRQWTGLGDTQQWLAAHGDVEAGVPVMAF